MGNIIRNPGGVAARDADVLQGVADQRGPIGNAELLHDPAAIGGHGFGRQAQPPGDLTAGHARHRQVQHFTFAVAQTFERTLPCVLQVHAGERIRQLCTEILPALHHREHGLYDFGGRRLLEHIAQRAGAQRMEHLLGTVQHRQHDHPRIRQFRQDSPRRVQSAHFRQDQIHHDHSRFVCSGRGNGLRAGGGGGGHGDSGILFQDIGEAFTQNGVIIDDQDTDRAGRAHHDSTIRSPARRPWNRAPGVRLIQLIGSHNERPFSEWQNVRRNQRTRSVTPLTGAAARRGLT